MGATRAAHGRRLRDEHSAGAAAHHQGCYHPPLPRCCDYRRRVQVAVALLGSDLIYFELNANGQLLEVEKKEGLADITSLALAAVPEGRQRSSVLVAGCADNTVRVLSLEPAACLAVKATQSTASPPASVMLMAAAVSTSGAPAHSAPFLVPVCSITICRTAHARAAGGGVATQELFLHVGLQDGTLMRASVDALSGALSDSRKRFLGTRPPMLLPAVASGSPALLALTSRPWLAHSRQGQFELVPLAYDALDYVAPFCSEKVPEGLVAVVRGGAQGTGTLRVLMLDRLAEKFTQKTLPLAFTPRRLLVDDAHSTVITAEADKAAIPHAERGDLRVRPYARPMHAQTPHGFQITWTRRVCRRRPRHWVTRRRSMPQAISSQSLRH